MKNHIMTATVYVGFGGVPRYDDQRFKDEELNKWIEDNVDDKCRNFSKWGGKRPPYLAGIYLEPEQALIFRLKFSNV